MNFFLHINRKFIILFGAIIIFLFLIIIFYKQINLNNIILENTINSTSNADISEPKFAINNDSKKIYITASQGNFINKDEVLLNKNVRFKSNDFSIETEKVIFNRDKQTAKSKTKSMFKSKDATITSDGFIYIEVPDGEVAMLDELSFEREEFYVEHPHIFSMTSLVLLIEQADLKVVTCERLCEPSGKYTLRAFCNSL